MIERRGERTRGEGGTGREGTGKGKPAGPSHPLPPLPSFPPPLPAAGEQQVVPRSRAATPQSRRGPDFAGFAGFAGFSRKWNRAAVGGPIPSRAGGQDDVSSKETPSNEPPRGGSGGRFSEDVPGGGAGLELVAGFAGFRRISRISPEMEQGGLRRPPRGGSGGRFSEDVPGGGAGLELVAGFPGFRRISRISPEWGGWRAHSLARRGSG